MSQDAQEHGQGEQAVGDPQDIEKYLEQRAQMDSVFADKFTRVLTVVFTDLKGSTTIAETEGDLVSRLLIKEHNEIVFPAIKGNDGIFIKSIGDGTLSYFESAQKAVRAAVSIQKGMDALNMSGKFKIPVLMRIGMHTGKCIVEKSDIFGDTVNTASRFESNANPGEIFISEETYNALDDKGEIYCHFAKQVTLKGKKEPYNAYKAFWNPIEIERDKQQPVQVTEPVENPAGAKKRIAFWILTSLVIVLLLMMGARFLSGVTTLEARRSIDHSITR